MGIFSFEFVYTNLSKWYNAFTDFFALCFVPFADGLSDILQELGISSDISSSLEEAVRGSIIGDLSISGLLLTFIGVYCILVVLKWLRDFLPTISAGGGGSLIPK